MEEILEHERIEKIIIIHNQNYHLKKYMKNLKKK